MPAHACPIVCRGTFLWFVCGFLFEASLKALLGRHQYRSVTVSFPSRCVSSQDSRREKTTLVKAESPSPRTGRSTRFPSLVYSAPSNIIFFGLDGAVSLLLE